MKLNGSKSVKIINKLIYDIDIAGGKGLSPTDIAYFITLINLFNQFNEIPFKKVLNEFWPEKDPEQQARYFRDFKKRVNERFQSSQLTYRLQHQSSNMAISKKTVWIEEMVSEYKLTKLREKRDKEANVIEVADRIAREQKPYYPETPMREYIEPKLAYDSIPMSKFPETVESFALQVAREEWNGISNDHRSLLKNMGTRLEPVVRILPPCNREFLSIAGFECHAIGPAGESLVQIMKITRKVDPVLVQCLIIIVALKSSSLLQSKSLKNGIWDVCSLFFIINLDEKILNSSMFVEVLKMFGDILNKGFIFGLIGKLSGKIPAL